MTKRQHPEALRPFLPEIGTLAKFCHLNVLFPILRYEPIITLNITTNVSMLRLLAIGLELPEGTFVKQYGFDAESDTWCTYQFRCCKRPSHLQSWSVRSMK